MKTLYGKKEKGVSPVIATILMVAITVVLASAVYLMVSGYIGSAPSKPVALGMSPSTNATATEFLITSGNISVSTGSPLIITITPTSGSPVPITLTSVATPSPQPSTTYKVYVYSVTGTKYLAGGDTIVITAVTGTAGWGSPLSPGTTVTFTYNGNVIYKYTA
jgi:flagellin-like protein